jgi:hypothetical protein
MKSRMSGRENNFAVDAVSSNTADDERGQVIFADGLVQMPTGMDEHADQAATEVDIESESDEDAELAEEPRRSFPILSFISRAYDVVFS